MQLTIAAPTPSTGAPTLVVPDYTVTDNGDGTFTFEVPADVGHLWITWPGYDQALYQWDERTPANFDRLIIEEDGSVVTAASDPAIIAANVAQALQSGSYGMGSVLRVFVSKVEGSPVDGVTVQCFDDESLTKVHGDRQVSDTYGRTYWCGWPGQTVWLVQIKSGFEFDVERENF